MQAMEQLVEKGLAKAIGISNFTIMKTENLLKTAKIVPAVNQGILARNKQSINMVSLIALFLQLSATLTSNSLNYYNTASKKVTYH